MRPWWWRPRRRDQDIAEEIASHLTMATQDRIARGESADAARDAAAREFGNSALVRQSTREVWSATRLEHLLQDLRFGARILRQASGLSLTAVLLIALVIGGNTTIYSIVNGLLVSPAVGVTAPRLVALKLAEPGMPIPDPFVSLPNFDDYARLTTTLSSLTGWSDERLTLGTRTGNHAVLGGLVTTNYFETFGISIVMGRALRPGDDDGRDGIVAVISDRLWREQFDQTAAIIGRTVHVNRVPVTIVGVTAAGFAGATMLPAGEDIWLPLRPFFRATGSSERLVDRGQPLVLMVGARRPGTTQTMVATELGAITAQLRAAFPAAFTTYTTRGVTPLRNPRVSVADYSASALLPVADLAPRFLAFFSIVTLLTLVIVSANVANLMLGRAVVRQRDTAVRRSLGASRVRIVRMLLAEGAAIAGAAWLAACLFAWWTAQAALRIIEPRPGFLAAVRPDWTLAAYAMLLAAGATMAFTLAPALRAWRLPVLPLLRSGEHGVARGRSRLSNTLVVLQLAFCVLLLTSAGLAYRSVAMLGSGDVAFDAERLLLATVRVGQQNTVTRNDVTPGDRAAELAALERVRQRLREERGVDAVSFASRIPGPYFLGTTPVRRGDVATPTFVRAVGPDYLGALGLSPLHGRDLSARDQAGAPATAVINRQLADELFPGQSALGHMLSVEGRSTLVEIVGVAPNALFDGPVRDPRPRYLFTAVAQTPGVRRVDMTFFVRHHSTVEAMAPQVGRAIADASPSLPLVSTTTMSERLAQVTELETQVTRLLVAFAVASLVVAALGLYAVATFNMRRRTRDFGVRLALGASVHQIQKAVLRESISLTFAGLIFGFALSLGAGITFRSVLFGVTPLDPPTYAGVFVVLAVASIVAAYRPAWQAGRVNVVEALRQE